ncbi:MAG: cell shape determination protein CcmA [Spirochaetales bacterium]|nr:cell shape determination protein CcmA [Spirochaetales bacterium]
MPDLRIKPVDETEIDTILADDIDFTGELSFDKPLMIKGKFSGEIKASGDLYIGDEAYVAARVDANVVSLKGKLKGDIYAKSRVELFSTATVEGDITSPDIIMESGCRFNGMCKMSSPRVDQSGEQPS